MASTDDQQQQPQDSQQPPSTTPTVVTASPVDYTWSQEGDQITVSFSCAAGTVGKDIDYNLTSTSIRVGIKDQKPHVEGTLYGTVSPDDCLWQLEKGDTPTVTLNIEKENSAFWPIFIKGEAEKGGLDVQAKHDLALFYENSQGNTSSIDPDLNMEKAFRYLQESAEGGCMAAQLKMAAMYRHGNAMFSNIVVDRETSNRYLTHAATGGSSDAQVELGRLFATPDEGKEPNMAEATRWFEIAAGQGNVHGMFQAGVTHHAQQNYAKAVLWWQKAGRKGHSHALYNLGVLFMYGRGVDKNMETAQVYFSQAVRIQPSLAGPINQALAAEAMAQQAKKEQSSGSQEGGAGPTPQVVAARGAKAAQKQDNGTEWPVIVGQVALLGAIAFGLWRHFK